MATPRDLLVKPAGMSQWEWAMVVRGRGYAEAMKYVEAAKARARATSAPAPIAQSAPATTEPSWHPIETQGGTVDVTPTTPPETPAAVYLKVATDISNQLIAAGFGGYWTPEMVEAQLFHEGPLRGTPQASGLTVTGTGVATITGPQGTTTVNLADFNVQMKEYETAYAKASVDQATQIASFALKVINEQAQIQTAKAGAEPSFGESIMRGITGGFSADRNVFSMTLKDMGLPQYGQAVVPYIKPVVLAAVGGVLVGAVSAGLAPVGAGIVEKLGKLDVFAKLAEHAGPAVQTMYEVEKGAIIYATPYIARQVGLIAFTGIETYKAKTMYEAGVSPLEIVASIGSDVASMAGFAKGFQAGYEMGLPPRVERALVGTPKLFVKGEYVEGQMGTYVLPTEPMGAYKLPSIRYLEGAEAFYKRTGGLLSRLTAPFGQVPIEAGMVLPTDVINLATGEVSKGWGLVSSMRLQQIETWARVQPFKLGVPLEKGTEIIETRLIGVQALGDTQSIRYWSGVSARAVGYTPFEGELFEPWTLTKMNLAALKTYILAPKELIAASAEGWAQIQMNVARTIYPAGVLYPERPIGILDKEWYTTKMYDVGRAMDQITSMYITKPGRVVGESFAKIQFELTPARVYTISGTGPIGYGAKALEGVGAGFKLSDSIAVAGGGAVQAPNWAQQAQLLRRQVELLEPAEEMFSPFMAHPLVAPSTLQKGLPSVETILGAGVSVGLLNLVSGKAASAITLKQLIEARPALTQVLALAEISAIIPVSAVVQAPAQALVQAQLLATIQAQVLITPTITPPTFAPPPPPPSPSLVPFLPSDLTPAMFFPKKRKVKKGGKKYGERLWYVGPLEPKLPKLNTRAVGFVMPKIRKLNIKRFDRVKLPRQPMTKLPKTSMPKLPKLKLPRMKKMRRLV